MSLWETYWTRWELISFTNEKILRNLSHSKHVLQILRWTLEINATLESPLTQMTMFSFIPIFTFRQEKDTASNTLPVHNYSNAIQQNESIENFNGQFRCTWTASESYMNTSYSPLRIVHTSSYIHHSSSRAFNFDNTVETSSVLVYPNPVIRNLTIEGNTNELESLTILNESGQDVSSLVRINIRNRRTLRVDVSSLPVGNFHVRTITNLIRVSKIK